MLRMAQSRPESAMLLGPLGKHRAAPGGWAGSGGFGSGRDRRGVAFWPSLRGGASLAGEKLLPRLE